MTAATAKNAKNKPAAAAKGGAKPAAKSSGLGLGGVGDLSALLKPAANSPASGGPIMLDLDLIDEDPNQPRKEDNPGFSHESLAELASTIKLRNVKTPISVRENKEQSGRYIINHGARRYRASKLAEKKQIPAFVDNDYNDDDQVIENLQRDGLTAREVADFIGREIAKGRQKKDIAKGIGKSPAFVSQHVTLLDLPEPIAKAFNTDRVRDVTLVNELVKAFKKDPQEVEDWLDDESQDITRGSVKTLIEFLEEKTSRRDPNTVDAFSGVTDAESDGKQGDGGSPDGQADAGEAHGAGGQESGAESDGKKEADPTKLKKAIVQVQHYGRPARLVLDKRPSEVGLAWFKYDDDGEVFEAAITEAKLVAVIEA